MPIEHWVEKEERRIRAVVVGDFTIEDILATIDAAIGHPDFEPGFNILSDHTNIGEPITTQQMQQMTDHLKRLTTQIGGARWAVVTTKPASYGMIRMLSVLAESIPLQVESFESLEDAEAWLRSP